MALHPYILNALMYLIFKTFSFQVIVGKVIFNMADLTLVPFTFGIMDKDGNCAGVSVYNLVQVIHIYK